jgi:hypothetical protein
MMTTLIIGRQPILIHEPAPHFDEKDAIKLHFKKVISTAKKIFKPTYRKIDIKLKKVN